MKKQSYHETTSQNYLDIFRITQVMYEDWRLTLPLANSTKNDITVVINHIMKEAVRETHRNYTLMLLLVTSGMRLGKKVFSFAFIEDVQSYQDNR